MKPDRGAGILTEMSHIVIDHVNESGISLKSHSFFNRELSKIQDVERREFLRDCVSDATLTLLSSVMDMVVSLDGVLASTGSSVSPYILIRSILEHSYKMTYLADGGIDSNERICRALRATFAEMREYEKLPESLRSRASDKQIVKRKQLAAKWYSEITGKQLNSISAQEIFDTVWRSGPPPDASGPEAKNNPNYQRYYRISSAITHGTRWGLQHYCLRTPLSDGWIVTSSSLDPETVRMMRITAGRLLMFAFGFTVQLHDTIPAGPMNRIGELEAMYFS